MRADRLLAMLLHLERHRGATAADLAERLEVSVRTIYRDVAALQAAGVPVWTETGPGGGIRLLDGWRAPVEGLTADEASALFLTGVPSAAAELGLGALMASGRTKLLATLPPELRSRAGRIAERFHLDAPGWFHRQRPVEHLGPVADAVWSGRRLDVVYAHRSGARRRRLDPLGLVLKAGTWYLVARHRGRVLTYRVDRITAARTRSERFERPAGFDLAVWWAASSAEFDRSLLRLPVRVRLGPSGWHIAPQVLTGAAIDVAGAGPPDDEGWRTVEVAMETEEVALGQLTALGAEVEVLEPGSLRAALAEVGRRVAARNGAGDGDGAHRPAQV